MSQQQSKLRRTMFMSALIIAGEAIFSLPFHIARFFRPTLLRVLGISNTQFGIAQGAYGVTATIAYFPGGPLADRFSPRKLIAASLATTALGGLYFATFPARIGLMVVFGFWGFSTILLFWAALQKATRQWGGDDEQGRAFGILDGGRGLLAAVVALVMAGVFAAMFPEDVSTVTPEQRTRALRMVILLYSAITLATAVLVWFCVTESEKTRPDSRRLSEHVVDVLRRPTVWYQAVIVVNAYVAYKAFDNFSIFAHRDYEMNEVTVASFMAVTQWIRPAAAVAAGLLGDRVGCSRVVILCFVLLLGTSLYYVVFEPHPSSAWILFTNAAIASAAMFGLRGVYFALFEEAALPMAITGTAVGMVSVLGYTPDIFVAPVTGYLLDIGHRPFFVFLTLSAAIGLMAAVLFRRACRSCES